MVISHLDCDTIPFLWQLADRFALFDNFRQTETGSLTPDAIVMIGGQSGDTQWVLHPDEADPTGPDAAQPDGLAAVRRQRHGQRLDQATIWT